ncbi:alpha/beta hydrolase family protein [Spongiactinospora sp. TRM90649]|uniref:alpha/beta hydrolase n=1 Tax=Spongiactinospora sp. TRM90649 TaxID=3031114 RepID=UPI0023F67B9F|nr:alpha/beta hydrolase family protein [Spongiactinospora sp. TRM90649]MDF5753884.1 alpha/beta hydrolase family protein [Spongiactinospora sp. TRM90649]
MKSLRIWLIVLTALVAVTATVTALWGRPGSGSGTERAEVAAERAGPRIVDRIATGQRGHDLTVESPALGRTASVRVLLPSGWRPGSGPWPVLYLLHGCCQSGYAGWAEEGGAERLTSGLPMIVVMPEGGRVGFYSDWRDGPAWETFHIRELIPLMEAEFGAGRRRAVAGFSMGGLGAIGYAARHPGTFQAAAAYSGVLDTTGDRAAVRDLVSSNGEDPAALWGDLTADDRQWDEHNPTVLAERLRGMKVYVSSGNGEPGPLDPPGTTADYEGAMLAQSKTFVGRARDHGAKVTTDFYGPGTHTWPYWERALQRSLPLLRAAIGA